MRTEPVLVLLLAAALGPAAGAAPPAKGAAKPAAKPAAPVRLPMFQPASLELAPGETFPVELFVPSPTGKAATGKLAYTPSPGLAVTPDPRWSGRLPAWGAKTHPKVTAKADASGDLKVEAGVASGQLATLPVKVAVPSLEATPGFKKLTVRVTNPFQGRPLIGRVQAANPDRFLQDVTALEFKIAPGQSADLVFPLPGAAAVATETYQFTLTLQTYQGFRSVQKLDLQFPESDPP